MLRAFANLTPRDQAILLDLARVGVTPADLIARAHFPSQRSARDRLATLVQRGLVESATVSPLAYPRPLGRLLALTPAGCSAVEQLGGVAPDRRTVETGALNAATAVAVAEAYFSLRGAVDWTLRPIYKIAPTPNTKVELTAWASARWVQKGKSTVELIFDLDLPGRTYSQVESRLKDWDKVREGAQICYTIADGERRKRIDAVITVAPWLHIKEHPRKVALALFSKALDAYSPGVSSQGP